MWPITIDLPVADIAAAAAFYALVFQATPVSPGAPPDVRLAVGEHVGSLFA